MADTVDIEKRLDGLGRSLAQALAAKWQLLGLAGGAVAQDQREFVASAVWDLDGDDQAAVNALVDSFIGKVHDGIDDKQAIILHPPESGAHAVGHDKDKIGAYCRTMIGFITTNTPAAG